MKKVFYIILIAVLLFSSSFTLKNGDKEKLTDYVNPFIGTGGHGHTYPGVCLPFGMVQLSPDTRLTGWDGCSGYYYTDDTVYGFSHTHLSGTGCSDYGDILLMPTTGNLEFDNQKYCSTFQKKNEFAMPGYYSVFLDKYKIKVELTATERTGMHKYSFPKGTNSKVLIDLKHRDEVMYSYIQILNDSTVVGLRRSAAWAKDQIVYFAAVFSKPFYKHSIAVNDIGDSEIKLARGRNIKAYFTFNTDKDSIIYVRVGISAVDVDGAMKNLEGESQNFSFDEIENKANEKWEKELSKIKVEGGTKEQNIIFYTALYHAMLAPNLYSDIDGRYRGRDNKIHKAENFDYYTVFSLWDTYRAEHPLLTILDIKRTNDFINTFLREYAEGGLLPVWELSSNETFCMIGYHCVPIIVDAYIKGIRNYDVQLAFKAIRNSADTNLFGLDAYKVYHYIPCNYAPFSVSKTLEYAYDDWCIAQMAKSLNDEDEYKRFIQRAQSYKYLYDYKNGFLRPRYTLRWYTPFDPYEVNIHYTEADCWQYNFYVPQDVQTYAKMMGGKEKFGEKLDELFTTTSKMTGYQLGDLSGFIGQYSQGNEPSHHVAYMYDYIGEPWKTQKYARKIMDDFYTSKPDGLIGNDDCGQMSAWYVLSAMGFYPVCPGQKDYEIGTPIFKNITINLENGKSFIIKADNVSDNNIYIQSAKLNGKNYTKCFLSYDDIMAGGTLEFVMGPNSNTNWGSGTEDTPQSLIKDNVLSPENNIFDGNAIMKKMFFMKKFLKNNFFLSCLSYY
jgi:predicted alpha-1,2-mannosidase